MAQDLIATTGVRCNGYEVARQSGIAQNDSAAMLAALRSTPSVSNQRFLDPHGMNCMGRVESDGGQPLRLRLTAEAVAAELARRGAA